MGSDAQGDLRRARWDPHRGRLPATLAPLHTRIETGGAGARDRLHARIEIGGAGSKDMVKTAIQSQLLAPRGRPPMGELNAAESLRG